MGNIFGDILSGVGAVAGFFPGGQVIGKIAGAGSALLNAGKANRQAQRISDQQLAEFQKQRDFYNSQFNPMLQKMVDGANSYDPYATNNVAPGYRHMIEGNAGTYDNAIENLGFDYEDRGIGRSTGFDSGTASLRRDQANTNAGSLRDIYKQNQDEAHRRLMELLPILQGGQQNAIGGLGGLTNLYNSKADGANSSLAQFSALLAAGRKNKLKPMADMGGFGSASAGDNTYGTNQVGTPTPTFPGHGVTDSGMVAGPSDFKSALSGVSVPGAPALSTGMGYKAKPRHRSGTLSTARI